SQQAPQLPLVDELLSRQYQANCNRRIEEASAIRLAIAETFWRSRFASDRSSIKGTCLWSRDTRSLMAKSLSATLLGNVAVRSSGWRVQSYGHRCRYRFFEICHAYLPSLACQR